MKQGDILNADCTCKLLMLSVLQHVEDSIWVEWPDRAHLGGGGAEPRPGHRRLQPPHPGLQRDGGHVREAPEVRWMMVHTPCVKRCGYSGYIYIMMTHTRYIYASINLGKIYFKLKEYFLPICQPIRIQTTFFVHFFLPQPQEWMQPPWALMKFCPGFSP